MNRIAAFSIAFFFISSSLLGGYAFGQCILTNPSFEIGGSGGMTFGGWNQFGVVGQAAEADHGQVAARVTGPDNGEWGVSGYWQPLDSEPGEQWEATVRVRHPSTNPLTGGSAAIVNIEWRDSGGNLIDYESHTAADANTPADEYRDFSVVSGPAPTGTASARILLGVLHDPSQPAPDVEYDRSTFFSLRFPTIDDQQWNDFPGGRTIDFGDRSWRVKGPGYYGPGPSLFCDGSSCVWVDGDGRLHLTIQNLGGSWYSTEVTLEEALGYGDYIFTTYGRLDTLDPNAVFGLFLWQYGPCWDPAYLWWNPYNEIDVEFSRWGDPGRDIGQFVAQPYDWPGNISRFDAVFADGELTSHAFRWLADRIEYRSWRGGPVDEAPENLIHSWTYTGLHIPRPEQPRAHLNLWQFDGSPSTNQEVVLDDFTFVPDGVTTDVIDRTGEPPPYRAEARLFAARPNPFNPSTTIRFTMESGGGAEIDVYDPSGRHMRNLVSGFVPAGSHETIWDGRDDEGNPVASGVYLYRLRAGDVVESRRMVLVR